MMQLLKAIQEMMEPTEQKGKACTRRWWPSWKPKWLPGEKRYKPTEKRGRPRISRQIQKKYSPQRSIKSSLRNMPQGNLSENRGSGVGVEIWPQSATKSQRNRPGYTVDPQGNWPPPAWRWPTVQKWHGTRETSSGRTGLGTTWYEEPWKDGT
jgi:hypothetical protein